MSVRGFLLFVTMLLATAMPAFAAPDAQNFDEAIAKAKANVQVDPRQALAAAHDAERFIGAIPDPAKRTRMTATTQWLMGEAYLRIDEGQRAIPLIEDAFADIDKLQPGTALHGDLLLSMGGIATERGKIADALSYYQRAHAVFRSLGDTRSEARALIQIGNLYYDANDWKSSLRYFGEALGTYNTDPGLSFSIRNGRGLALTELNDRNQARHEFDSALKLARQMKSPLLEATVLNNAARLELSSGDIAKADRAIADSRRATGAQTPPEFRKQQDALAAEAAFQHREYRRAAALVENVFRGIDLAHTSLAEREAHRTAYATYRALGRDGLALAHLQALKRLDDDATTLARSNSAALMSARFDFANQSLRIANLQAQDARKTADYERARARSQRIIFFGASGAVAVVFALLLYALRTSRKARVKVQTAADDLALTNDALGKALAAKTEFLATTSHEIRTPLNGILGMTQVMLVDTSLSAATRDRVGVVHEAGITMRALVDDILDVAKMETGNLTIEDAPFDLKALALDATRLWTVQAEAKGLTFVRTLEDCPGLIRGDAARVRQILFNLMSNALKFTAEGSVGLSIVADGDRYRIAVADSGVGIAADKRETIFESFRQADTSTTRQFGGTGLGLSICRNLARAMGGDVTVSSVEGEGATFTVDLPLVTAPVQQAAAAVSTGAVDLLIVDRNPITRSMLKAVFAPRFAAIDVVGSMAEAQARVEAGGIGGVLIDDATVRLGTPLDDLAALAAVGDAPIALLWPVGADSERAELLATGIDLVIAKPVSGAVLAEKVGAMFGRRYGTALETEAA